MNELNKLLSFNLDTIAYKWVGDFYFDARYPGDNFVEVSKDDAIKCIELTESLKNCVDSLETVTDKITLTKLSEMDEFTK